MPCIARWRHNAVQNKLSIALSVQSTEYFSVQSTYGVDPTVRTQLELGSVLDLVAVALLPREA